MRAALTDFDQADRNHWLRHELKAVLEFCFWVVLLGPAAQIILWASTEGFPIPWEKVTHHYLLIFIHFFCYVPVFCAGLVLLRARRIRLNWLVAAVGYLTLAVLCSLAAAVILAVLGIKPFEHLSRSLFMSTAVGMVITAIVLVIERLYHSNVTSRLDAQRRELDRERAQRTAVEAQWNSLESRVQPHFLFNTLSSIRELMHRDVAAADSMIQRFADLIRFSLDSSRNTLVPLEEELRTVSAYLEIEKMRLGSRLNWKVLMPRECRLFTVPSLSVLTLAENSVKHVISRRRSGGFVEVAPQIEGDRLRITVSDDGPGFDESSIIRGHGVDLLLQRLENLYQDEASLVLTPAIDGVFAVTLLIPEQSQNIRQEPLEAKSAG